MRCTVLGAGSWGTALASLLASKGYTVTAWSLSQAVLDDIAKHHRNERYLPGESRDCDLTVIPLCLHGGRAAIYSSPSSPAVLVHDWIWRRRGAGAVVSAALLKRLNLVRR